MADPPERFSDERRETDASLEAERACTDQILEPEPLQERVDEALSQERAEAEDRLRRAREEVDAHLDQQAQVLPQLVREAEKLADALGTREPHVIGALAEIAGGIANVATDLEAEREKADETLKTERELTDHILDEQTEQTEAVIVEDLTEHRDLLAVHRNATDADLASERRHTDEAVECVLHMLERETGAHAAARATYATRNEFLAIVSHDLRGPLNAMMVAATLIAGEAPDDERGRRIRGWAESIRHSSAVMNRLVKDLLDFASLEDGRLQVAAKPHDMRDLVRRAIALYEPLAAQKSLTVETNVPDTPVTAAYDPDRMLQVVSNLLQNAIKFTPEGGAIRLRLAKGGGDCLIAISDNGIGIPGRDMASIFERFKQVRRQDQDENDGLGLGLYISKWIVDAHHGRIWAESREGRGSTFYVAVPAVN